MRDPLEGLSESGTIRTGADIERVSAEFRPIHDAAVAAVLRAEASASVYAYGSVVTGQAVVGVSDVDLLAIGLQADDASRIGSDLSARFATICRGVEIGAADARDFMVDTDEAYGNRVFLRHYCVLLAGSGAHRPRQEFAGDRRSARGFNGDIAQHARRWHDALDSGSVAPGDVARRMARKSLLAVAGLVSVHDRTWTTDRETGADRWADIVPDQRSGLAQLVLWSSSAPDASIETVSEVLDVTVEAIVKAFSDLIGLWLD